MCPDIHTRFPWQKFDSLPLLKVHFFVVVLFFTRGLACTEWVWGKGDGGLSVCVDGLPVFYVLKKIFFFESPVIIGHLNESSRNGNNHLVTAL